MTLQQRISSIAKLCVKGIIIIKQYFNHQVSCPFSKLKPQDGWDDIQHYNTDSQSCYHHIYPVHTPDNLFQCARIMTPERLLITKSDSPGNNPTELIFGMVSTRRHRVYVSVTAECCWSALMSIRRCGWEGLWGWGAINKNSAVRRLVDRIRCGFSANHAMRFRFGWTSKEAGSRQQSPTVNSG